MYEKYSVQPGVNTPYHSINKLLNVDERFLIGYANGEQGFLLAPKTISCLSALLFLLQEQELCYSKSIMDPTKDSIVLSLQNLKQINLLDHHVVEIEAGCDLLTLRQSLFEQGFELALENDVISHKLVGDIILAGNQSGLILRQMNNQERLLAVDIAKSDGGIVKLGRPLRGGTAGSTLHQLIWGIKQLDALLVKAAFRIDPIPPARLHLTWTFEHRNALWEHFHQLMHDTSTWERLDCLIPRQLNEKGIIVGQISGLKEEIEAFKLDCPLYNNAIQGDQLCVFKGYFRQQKASFEPASGIPATDFSSWDYFWYHGLIDDGWLIHFNEQIASQKEAFQMPLWKKRLFACLELK